MIFTGKGREFKEKLKLVDFLKNLKKAVKTGEKSVGVDDCLYVLWL